MRVRFQDITKDCDSWNAGEWIDKSRRQVRLEQHVTALYRGEAGNARAVKGDPPGQKRFIKS